MLVPMTALLPEFLCLTLETSPSHRIVASWKSKIPISHTLTTVFYTYSDTTMLAPDLQSLNSSLSFHLSNSSWLCSLPIPPKFPATCFYCSLTHTLNSAGLSPGSISLETIDILNVLSICFCFCDQAGNKYNTVSCSELKICIMRYFPTFQESRPTRKWPPLSKNPITVYMSHYFHRKF